MSLSRHEHFWGRAEGNLKEKTANKINYLLLRYKKKLKCQWEKNQNGPLKWIGIKASLRSDDRLGLGQDERKALLECM